MSGPLIVQSDRTVLLEVAHPDAEDARHELSVFAELERAPEHVHTYRITRLGLWNARAAGHTAEQMLSTLERFAKFPVPQTVAVDITETVGRYGRLVIDRDADGELIITTTDPAVLAEITRAGKVAALLGIRRTSTEWTLQPWARGQIKQELLKLGWPAEDHAGYTPGTPHDIGLVETGWAMRGYQQKAIDNFFDGGSGVVVLPCGAGKTIVGAGAMAEADTTTLILVTNTVSARQWRTELLKRTTLTEDEIGEYSGERKEIKPVTIATYQILTAKRKGEFAHLALLDALDWGLIIYDEVHLLPAPVFKLTAELQARRRLGLTATLVREDGRESDVFSLIGPKRFDAPWKEIEAQGYISPASCYEVRIDLPASDRLEYAASADDERYRLAATAPAKLQVVKDLIAKHEGERILVIGQYLDQIDTLAEVLERAVAHRRDADRRARAAVRGVPRGAPEGARRVEGRELLDRPARGDRRHPGVGFVRVTAGGGAAPRPSAAPEGERHPGVVLHPRRARHRRSGLRAEPAAVPRRAGLLVHDPRRAHARCGVTLARLRAGLAWAHV